VGDSADQTYARSGVKISRMRSAMERSAIAAGTVLGLIAAAFLTRFAEALLFGIVARDPITLVPSVLLVIAVAATFTPVRQATSIAPSQALRYE